MCCCFFASLVLCSPRRRASPEGVSAATRAGAFASFFHICFFCITRAVLCAAQIRTRQTGVATCREVENIRDRRDDGTGGGGSGAGSSRSRSGACDGAFGGARESAGGVAGVSSVPTRERNGDAVQSTMVPLASRSGNVRGKPSDDALLPFDHELLTMALASGIRCDGLLVCLWISWKLDQLLVLCCSVRGSHTSLPPCLARTECSSWGDNCY